MDKKKLLTFAFPLLLGIPVFCAVTDEPWTISYSLYRLIYSFTLTENARDVYVNVVIPTSVIDNYLDFWISKGINLTYFREAFYPRVYFYNPNTGRQVIVQNDVIWLSTYRGFYYNFTVHLTNLQNGTYYIFVYLPAYLWEDFEDNTYNTGTDVNGACIDGEWCQIYETNERGNSWTKILRGSSPTETKGLWFYAAAPRDISFWNRICLERKINLNLTLEGILLEYKVGGRAVAGDVLEVFVCFNTIEGEKCIGYCSYGCAGIPTSVVPYCNEISVGSSVKREVLADISQACNIPFSDIKQLTRLVICANLPAAYGTDYIWLDNIKLIPRTIYG